MAVKEVWKGRVHDTVQVETAAETSACGASLRENEHYLIAADYISETVVATNKCAWTRPLARGAKLRALLDQAVVR
jgi:hypothetical protein